jgi:hypothetical protein
MKQFKIRNRKSGLFSNGGKYPVWTAKGKVWTKEVYVKAHLAQIKSNNLSRHPYAQAEIVESEIKEEILQVKDVLSQILDAQAEAFEKEQEKKEKMKVQKRKKLSAYSKYGY